MIGHPGTGESRRSGDIEVCFSRPLYARPSAHASASDTPFLGLWLVSIISVIVGLCFVWGSTTVSASLAPILARANPFTKGIPRPTGNRSNRSPRSGISYTVYDTLTYDSPPRGARSCCSCDTARAAAPPATNSSAGTDRESPPPTLSPYRANDEGHRAHQSPFHSSSPSQPGGHSSHHSNVSRGARARTLNPIGGERRASDGPRSFRVSGRA